MNLGENISVYRQNLKMTQEELSVKLGVTPQAISKWERDQSYPDIFTFAQLCQVLKVSADLLLETKCNSLSESGDKTVNEKVKQLLRDSEEPLVLEFGKGLLDVFLHQPYIKHIEDQRINLAPMGILMPIIRVRDNFTLNANEFMVLSYHRILYNEEVKNIEEHTSKYIAEKTANAIKDNYGYILNRDILKTIIENLKLEYPTVITGVVPEKISYNLLQQVCIGLLERGDGLCYMVKTIETMEEELRKHPDIEIKELICAVANEIEREDNYYVAMAKRK